LGLDIGFSPVHALICTHRQPITASRSHQPDPGPSTAIGPACRAP